MEDGAFRDGVVHHLFLKGTVSHECRLLFHFFACPLFPPYRFAVPVNGVDTAQMYGRCLGYMGKHAVLAD